MNTIEMNQAAVALLQKWDPFRLGELEYDTESADVVAALQSLDEPEAIAKVIQSVYEYSFEQVIPIEECLSIAYKLVAIKSNVVCTL